VFALGRAQELLLILEEMWESNPKLQLIPVYFASKLAGKALKIYQTFINMMNNHVQSKMDIGNPFQFSHVNKVKCDYSSNHFVILWH